MTQTFLSPGVNTPEVDQSFLQTGEPQTGAILVGRTPKGPAFLPTTVSNFSEFTAVFGGLDPNYQLPYAAKAYLANSTSLTVVRVLGHADGTATTNGYSVSSVIGITDVSGSNSTTGSILAVIHAGVPASQVFLSGVALDANRFVVRFGSTFAATASFLTSSDDYIGKALNTDPTKYSTYGHYLYQTFPYQRQAASASWWPVANISQSMLAHTRDYEPGVTTWVKSQLIGGGEYDLFRFVTLGHGRATNDEIKVTIENIRPSSSPTLQPYGTFDVVVRSFGDTDSKPVELRRFASLTLDPSSPNFIARQIGDMNEQFITSTRKFAVVGGTWPLRNRYIRVEMNSSANPPPQALPWGFRGYPRQLFSGSVAGNGTSFGIAAVPGLPYVPNQIDPNGNVNDAITWGVSFVSGGVADRMRALPDGNLAANLSGTDSDFSLKFLTGTYVNGVKLYAYNTATPSHLLYAPIFASGGIQAFTLPFFGGFDGWDLRTKDPLYLNNTDTDSVIGVVSQKRALDTVKNPDQISGDVLALPGQHNIAVTDYARRLVNARRDMFYVMDVTGSTHLEAIAGLNAREIDDSYAGAYYPDVILAESAPTPRMVRLPPSVGVLGALAYNDRQAQAFFAPAGLNRGGLGQFGIVDTVDRLQQEDRDELYSARINPITRFPNNGVVVFGQKTLQLRQSSLDRVNVRRLLILAKRAVSNFARGLIFEPNNPATWTRFVNKVNPILDGYRRDQGINRFKVVMDTTTNTSDVIDRNEMRGKIFLEPVKAAEFITVDFIISPSGVEFGS